MMINRSLKYPDRLRWAGTAVVLTLAAGLFLAALLLLSNSVQASSHREAPLISKDQFADNTDVYTFVSPNNPDNIVLASSWIPFESPEGGPNFFEWDDNVIYEIHVDSNGDAIPEATYSLHSKTTIQNFDTFLYNTGPITGLSDPDINRTQVISITETFRPGFEPPGSPTTNILVNNAPSVPVNIGSKSTPNYETLSNTGIVNATAPPGDSVLLYAGQTDDAFWVDLQVFDLLTLRGQAPPIGYSQGNNNPVDSLSGFNVHSLIIELPIDRLKQGSEPVLGVWATARRTGMNVFPPQPMTPVQVSRLGMPLTNEVVIPMVHKDVFNAITPADDLTIYSTLQPSVEDPELGSLLCGLYGIPLPGDSDSNCSTEFITGTVRSGRGDIFDIFLQGMELANDFTIETGTGTMTLPAGSIINRPAGVVPAEMLRINTDIKGSICAPTPNRLGLLGGDICGFPNGRRLTDDVVDIELLAIAGAAYQALDGRDTSFAFDPSLMGVLDDGIDTNDVSFRSSFPYLGLPQSGQEHLHQNPLFGVFLPTIMTGAFVIVLPAAAIWYQRKKEFLL